MQRELVQGEHFLPAVRERVDAARDRKPPLEGIEDIVDPLKHDPQRDRRPLPVPDQRPVSWREQHRSAPPADELRLDGAVVLVRRVSVGHRFRS